MPTFTASIIVGVVSLLEALGVEIGPRRKGSPEAARAAEAVAAAFRELGLDVRFQEFPLVGYEAEEPVLTLDDEPVAAGPCEYAQPTPADGVEGVLRRYGELLDLIFGGASTIWAIEDERGRALARVYENPVVADGGAIPFLSFYGPLVTGPSCFVARGDARLRDGAHARLRTGGRFVPGLTERNVLATLPGESEETIVVGAHYDSVWRGPGVIDNASGVEAMRRVAERLVGRTHPRTVLFAAWAAEEVGLVGSRWFVTDAKFRGHLSSYAGVVNLDCVAHGQKLVLMVAPIELRDRAHAEVERLGLDDRYDLETLEPGAGTDHVPFVEEKIPAIALMHFPYAEYHLPSETPELVDDQRLEDCVELAVALVESQLAAPVPKPE
jgi:hypothetical protein